MAIEVQLLIFNTPQLLLTKVLFVALQNEQGAPGAPEAPAGVDWPEDGLRIPHPSGARVT